MPSTSATPLAEVKWCFFGPGKKDDMLRRGTGKRRCCRIGRKRPNLRGTAFEMHPDFVVYKSDYNAEIARGGRRGNWRELRPKPFVLASLQPCGNDSIPWRK